MKKVITYTEEQVTQLKMLLNAVTVSGIQNARQITVIAQVLDSGIPGEINEPKIEEKIKGIYAHVDWESLLEQKTRISNEPEKKEGEG